VNRQPETEGVNPATAGLDCMPVEQLVEVLIAQQTAAAQAVKAIAGPLARAVDAIVLRLNNQGRLHYVGAGTSGRIAFADAAEMPPTFGTDATLVCAHLAGGADALTRAVEGAEDDADAGAAAMRGAVSEADAVIGVSASGSARYVVAALRAAREIGAWTMAIANVAQSPLFEYADLAVTVPTGPEPIAGSTRMNAGAAQKIVLATLSTAVMVRLNKVYDNLMVDVVATNAKLRERALRLVSTLTGRSERESSRLLEEAGGSVKVAAVMARRGVDAASARSLLRAAGGSLRKCFP
jgi:N-acetylmuramic acid 6-phosphate etherase